GGDGKGELHVLRQLQVVGIGELEPRATRRTNDVREEVTTHAHLLADRRGTAEGEGAWRILDTHPLVAMAAPQFEEGSAASHRRVEHVLIELVLRQLRQLLAAGVEHQGDQTEEKWMAHGSSISG